MCSNLDQKVDVPAYEENYEQIDWSDKEPSQCRRVSIAVDMANKSYKRMKGAK